MKNNTGRSMHCVTFTDSEISTLKHMLTEHLREINEIETEIKKEENELWANCDPSSGDFKSAVSFMTLNVFRTAKREVQKRKKKVESIQKALRASLNIPV